MDEQEQREQQAAYLAAQQAAAQQAAAQQAAGPGLPTPEAMAAIIGDLQAALATRFKGGGICDSQLPRTGDTNPLA